ncbi:chromatin associated protein KTI12 [Xylariaceae sp. FL0804]|nr:chromatin associated protein KTI12 [Xylariaceae sp. FL0804]
MPLVIVSGLPTSGKTTRAKQLYEYLSERITQSSSSSTSSSASSSAAAAEPRYRLHLISDQTLGTPRAVYDLSAARDPHSRSANAAEKDARAAAQAAVARALGPRDIVLLDGLNYIKGWRYQLFCEARAARTPSCVLQVGCARERAREVNEARLRRRRRRQVVVKEEGPGTEGKVDGAVAGAPPTSREEEEESEEKDEEGETEGDEGQDEGEDEAPYEPANWENLVYRYEEPNAMARWDSPLFTLIWEDGAEQTRRVFDALWDAVAGAGRPVVRPNQATVQRGLASSSSSGGGADYLYVLDRETQDVVRRVLAQQAEDGGGGGGQVSVSRSRDEGDGGGGGGGDEDLVVELPAGRKVGLPQLQRLRRAFVGLNRGGIGLEGVGSLGPGRIRESFVGYLNDAFEKDG